MPICAAGRLTRSVNSPTRNWRCARGPRPEDIRIHSSPGGPRDQFSQGSSTPPPALALRGLLRATPLGQARDDAKTRHDLSRAVRGSPERAQASADTSRSTAGARPHAGMPPAPASSRRIRRSPRAYKHRGRRAGKPRRRLVTPKLLDAGRSPPPRAPVVLITDRDKRGQRLRGRPRAPVEERQGHSCQTTPGSDCRHHTSSREAEFFYPRNVQTAYERSKLVYAYVTADNRAGVLKRPCRSRRSCKTRPRSHPLRWRTPYGAWTAVNALSFGVREGECSPHRSRRRRKKTDPSLGRAAQHDAGRVAILAATRGRASRDTATRYSRGGSALRRPHHRRNVASSPTFTCQALRTWRAIAFWVTAADRLSRPRADRLSVGMKHTSRSPARVTSRACCCRRSDDRLGTVAPRFRKRSEFRAPACHHHGDAVPGRAERCARVALRTKAPRSHRAAARLDGARGASCSK